MPTTSILDDPWPRITAACRRSRGDCAVAYVGQGATKLLPLRSGSTLVVDASDAAIKSGQTDPRELLKYVRDGVRVFSLPHLHAKVFAFSGGAFVGSTNVSNRSSDVLFEAAVNLRGKAAAARARKFVRELAASELGERFLRSKLKLYHPPRFADGGRRRQRAHPRAERVAQAAPLRVVRLVFEEWDAADWAADESGRRAAVKKKRRGFHLDSFGFRGKWNPLAPDEDVMMVTRDGSSYVELAPPGRALASRKVRGKREYVVQIELPKKRRRTLSAIRKRLARSTVKRLARGGLVAPKHAAALRSLWPH